jgi:hypothetical protein
MIKYVFTHFAKKFSQVKSEFDAPLDIVVAGGTSMPKGFCKKLEEVVKTLSLPFQIKEVRGAQDVRNSVVKGCLIYAINAQKKIEKGKESQKVEDKKVDNSEIDKVLGG